MSFEDKIKHPEKYIGNQMPSFEDTVKNPGLGISYKNETPFYDPFRKNNNETYLDQNPIMESDPHYQRFIKKPIKPIVEETSKKRRG